jgi:alpha-beta hydrolase superfamily lysophospholipase
MEVKVLEQRQGTVTVSGGLELFWQAWLPQQVRAAILLVHGFGEHSGRYDNLVRILLPAGFGIWSIDHRGHGCSPGLRGHVNVFSDYVEDLRTYFTKIVAPETGDLPFFVLGHSMGSIIAMNYVTKYGDGLAGCVLSGTGSASPVGGKALAALTAFFSRIIPRGRVKFPLPPEFISRDPEVVRAYKEDPLVHNKISFRLAAEMTRALGRGVKGIQGVNLPFLIQCGSEDESFIGQQQLFDGLQTEDKTLKIYPGLKHEVFNELEADRKQVLADLLQWLEGHI